MITNLFIHHLGEISQTNSPITTIIYCVILFVNSQLLGMFYLLQLVIIFCVWKTSVLIILYHLLPSSEKHALFLADEYHWSNMAVTFCTILHQHLIFHTNTEVIFMFKSTNNEKITGNMYGIFKDGAKQGEYMNSLLSPIPPVVHLKSWWST